MLRRRNRLCRSRPGPPESRGHHLGQWSEQEELVLAPDCNSPLDFVGSRDRRAEQQLMEAYCYHTAEDSSNLVGVASFDNFDCSTQAEAEAERKLMVGKVQHGSPSRGSEKEVCR